MKRILVLLGLLIIVGATYSQNWYLIENDLIVQTGIPTHFKSVIGYVPGQYQQLSDSIHYLDGWRNDTVPDYDSVYFQLGNRYYDTILDKVTWYVDSIDVEKLRIDYLNEIIDYYNDKILALTYMSDSVDVVDSVAFLMNQLLIKREEINNMNIKQLKNK